MAILRWHWLILCSVALASGCGQSPPASPPAPASPPEVPTATAPAADPAPTTDRPGDAAPMPTPAPATGLMTPAAIASASAQSPAAPSTPIKVSAELSQRVRAALEKPAPARGQMNRKNSLKMIGLALHNFHDTFNHFPAVDGRGDADAATGLSWRVHLLPYLDQAPLYNQFHLDEPWDSEHNKQFIELMPAIFGDNAEGKTRLHVFTGAGVPFQAGKGPVLSDITDGLSNTLAVVEAGADTAEIWTKPSGLEFDAKEPLKALGDVGETFLALFMDGAVYDVSRNVDGLANLIQHADGQVVTDDFRQPVLPMPVAAAEPLPPLPPLAPAATAVDTRMIPADALAAAIFQPRRFLEHDLVQSVLKGLNPQGKPPRDFLREALPPDLSRGLNELQVQADAIEEVRLIVGGGFLEFVQQPTPGIPPFAAAIRSATPLNVEAILASATRSSSSVEAREHVGVTYMCEPNMGMAVCFISEQEMLWGQEAVVQGMLGAGGVDTLLTQRLQANGNRLLVAALASDEMGPLLGQMAQQMPPQAQLFLPYISQWRGMALAVDLDAPELLQLSLQFTKPQLATGLSDMLQSQLQFGRDMFEQQKGALAQGETAAAVPLLTELIEGAELAVAGDTLTFRAARPEHLLDLPKALEPAFQQSRAAAERSQQRNMLKQIGLAMHNFHDVHHHFPALDGGGAPDPKKGLSWRVHLLPFLDQAPLYSEFKLDEPWDSEHNKGLIARMPAIFGANPEGKTRLHVFTGGGAPFQNGEGVKIQEITDGTSNTILVVEAGAETADIWTKPGGLEFDPDSPLQCLGALTGGGFNVLMMDGSVKFISEQIDRNVFRNLVQHADGNPLQAF
ncbi:MAG: DUF1559 domain-containing protein [Planctomycetaceae bacterium]|nr:DUF1559 domain-containing protein [Planctomycetaceae bacterium]